MSKRRKVRNGREVIILSVSSSDKAINEVFMANQGLNNDFELENPPFLRTYLPKHYGGKDPRKRTKGRGSQ